MIGFIFSDISVPADTNVSLQEISGDISREIENEHFETAISKFASLRSIDQADVLVKLNRSVRIKLLSFLTPKNMGLIVNRLDRDDVALISQEVNHEQLSLILDEARPDIAADILRDLSVNERAETLSGMRDSDGVVPLMDYEDRDAGGLMTPEFIALGSTMTVTQAMDFVRNASSSIDVAEVTYILVVNSQEALVGGLNVSKLVVSEPHILISEIMHTEIISVNAETDREECARIMERYNLLALPVVNDQGKLEGIVKLEDMIYVVQEEATEDMYKMVGVGEEAKLLGPFWNSVRGRLPWLCINLATAGIAALVITLFQETIQQVVALAVFLPVIAGQGAIVGTQTLTLVVRSMALGEIDKSDARMLLIKELLLGLAHGAVLGLIAGLIAFLWHGNQYLALVVGIAMLGNLIIAGISGVILPLGLKKLKVDPALSSAVVVTTVTDVVGFLIYLGLATMALSYIIGAN